jgi:Domain of unknown function (DUF4327)
MVQAVRFALPEICSEAQDLVARGRLNRRQPIGAMSRFYDPSEWEGIRQELELHELCLDNPVCDLVVTEEWPED